MQSYLNAVHITGVRSPDGSLSKNKWLAHTSFLHPRAVGLLIIRSSAIYLFSLLIFLGYSLKTIQKMSETGLNASGIVFASNFHMERGEIIV